MDAVVQPWLGPGQRIEGRSDESGYESLVS